MSYRREDITWISAVGRVGAGQVYLLAVLATDRERFLRMDLPVADARRVIAALTKAIERAEQSTEQPASTDRVAS